MMNAHIKSSRSVFGRCLPLAALALLVAAFASPSAGAQAPEEPSQMTGKGSLIDSGRQFSYAYILDCLITDPEHKFRGVLNGQSFMLTSVTSVVCTDEPGVTPSDPSVGFDTQRGRGAGTLGGSAVTAEWTFVDGGPEGTGDSAQITIRDSAGKVEFSGLGSPPGPFPDSRQPTGFNSAEEPQCRAHLEWDSITVNRDTDPAPIVDQWDVQVDAELNGAQGNLGKKFAADAGVVVAVGGALTPPVVVGKKGELVVLNIFIGANATESDPMGNLSGQFPDDLGHANLGTIIEPGGPITMLQRCPAAGAPPIRLVLPPLVIKVKKRPRGTPAATETNGELVLRFTLVVDP